jgi:hypothetical protein
MSNPDRDQLSVACELVGRYQYHFSKIEEALDRGVAKVLDLNEGAAAIVCANLDFVKKCNIIKSAVALQFTDTTGDLGQLMKDIAGLNQPDRQTVIHSTFEPYGDGVRFHRVTANKKLQRNPIDWSEDRFEKSFTKMDGLSGELRKVVEQLSPYAPSLDFSDPRNSMYFMLLMV